MSTSQTSPLKVKLTKCAFSLFATKGFKGVSVDMVAAKAGVTKGAMYWHFKSKKELILAACDYYYQQWHKEAKTQISKGETARKQLEQVIRMATKRCLFDRKNRLFTFDLSVLAMNDVEIRESWSSFTHSVREVYTNLIEKVSQEEGLNITAPKQNVDWYASTVEGIKYRAIFEPEICDPIQLEASVAKLLQIILR